MCFEVVAGVFHNLFVDVVLRLSEQVEGAFVFAEVVHSVEVDGS